MKKIRNYFKEYINSIKRFIKDTKKYKNYIVYATWAELKTEVINSYLGWAWMVLEPLAFMLIYVFIAGVIFNSKVQYFPVFVFIGLSIWNFFNKNVVASVKLVTTNRDTVTKVYLPKFVLLFVKMGVNLFKMIVSFILVGIFMAIYKVPVTWNVLWFFPIIITVVILTFGVCTFMLHFGVFAEDLTNLTNIFLRMIFYMTGVFYDLASKLEKHPVYKTLLLKYNPIANFIHNMRQSLIYSSSPDYLWIFIWFIIGLFLSISGVRKIYKYENTYVKVMR